MNPDRPLGSLNTQAHLDVARQIASEGIVLLKNTENFFPLDANKKMTIAVIGDNATRMMTIGGGSSELKAKKEISPLEGIQNRFKNATILYSMGYVAGPSAYGRVIPSKFNADSLKNAAIETAKKADIVLFMGGLNKNHEQDCEGGDRQSYALPYNQDALIAELLKVNPNLAVVLVSGNAVAMPWTNTVKGIMQAWYLGSETGNALADVLSGDVNPSGKLPFTFPVKLEDNAAHSFGKLSYPGDSINQYYKEDILVGYRWHDTKKIVPQFAFGYGLSYTNFNIADIQINKNEFLPGDKIVVQCNVQNIGNRAGAEVVQVYVGKLKSKVARATKELKGFSKVYIEKGGTSKVEISIDIKDIAYYDETLKSWNIEKGDYEIHVGNASNNIVKKLKFTVK